MKTKSIINSAIGNMIEWYDYGLFMIFAPLFNKIFFPTDTNYNLINIFIIFAIGFFCRPIGALLFGFLADKKGRAITLKFSVLMITIPTLFIGFLPSFNSLGYYSVVLLIVTRMWQGICIGGIHGGFLVYLTETAPRKKRAIFASVGTIGANLGILFAFIITFLMRSTLSETNFIAWGWRVPYFMSAIFCFIIYLSRFSFKETIPFAKLMNRNQITNHPVKTIFQTNKLTLLKLIGMCCMGSTFYCYGIIFFPYLLGNIKHFSANTTTLLSSIFLVLMIIFIPIGASICDRVGRRPMLLFNVCFILSVIFFSMFAMHENSIFLLIFAFILFSLGSAFEQSATPVYMIETLPTNVRYTTLSFAYNLGNGIFGGTLPLLCEWLWTGSYWVGPAIYVAVMTSITGLIVYFFVTETFENSLTT